MFLLRYSGRGKELCLQISGRVGRGVVVFLLNILGILGRGGVLCLINFSGRLEGGVVAFYPTSQVGWRGEEWCFS